MKKIDRKAFSFYCSYDDVLSDLDNEQLALFMRALLDVQFFRKHIEEISFEDRFISICWKASKFAIHKQLEGYCNANKISYNSLFDEIKDTLEAHYNPTHEACNEDTPKEEKEKEKEQELFIEREFNLVWKDYTLSFLKKQSRSGGSKKKALSRFKNLFNLYELKEIKNLIENEQRKQIGHRDLERVLLEENMNQFKEDGMLEQNQTHLVSGYVDEAMGGYN